MTKQTLRGSDPLPATAAWRYTLRPTNVERCFIYSEVIQQIHAARCKAADARQAERDRLRAISEAEVAKALLPASVAPAAATVAQEQEPVGVIRAAHRPGWFRMLFR
jgi:hypothetical protein